MLRTVIAKEIHENLISLRFLLLLVLAVVLVPASFHASHRAYRTRVADEQQVVERGREQLRALRVAQLFTNPNFTIDAYWPPSPGAVLAAGFEETHPRHLLLGRHGVEYGAPLDGGSSPGIFGQIDYLFLVELVFSLFAVLMAFDAITREKENGTLRSILANPIGRVTLAIGKLLGGFVSLAIPLTIAFLVGLLVLSASGFEVFDGEFLGRAAWILAASLIYLGVFFLLGWSFRRSSPPPTPR